MTSALELLPRPRLACPPVELWRPPFGLWCAVTPHPLLGAFNGYVQLPERHPWRRVDGERIPVRLPPIEMFGEGSRFLTWGPDQGGWVGFSTLELGDWWAPDDLVDLGRPLNGWWDDSVMREIGGAGLGGLGGHMRAWVMLGRRWTRPALRAAVTDLAGQLAGLGGMPAAVVDAYLAATDDELEDAAEP
jgi:hypothetical protein